jgi:hypothetical protein
MVSFGGAFRVVSARSRECDEGLDDKENEDLDTTLLTRRRIEPA